MKTSGPLYAFFSLGLLACVAYLTITTETSLVLKHPTSSWIVILSACAAVFLLFGRIQLLFSRDSRPNQQYAAVPLEDLRDRNSGSPTSSTDHFSKPESHSARYLWPRRVFLTLILILRTSIFQHTGATSLEAVVPIFIAIADCWQKFFRQPRYPSHGHSHDRLRQILAVRIFLEYICSPIVYVPILSGFGALAISYTPSALPSTYISPQNQVDAFDEPALVVLGVCLDGILAVYLHTVLDLAAKAQFSDESNTLFSLGISSSVAAAFWLILALPIQLWKGFEATSQESYAPDNFLLRILSLASVFALTTFFALHCVLHSGFLDTSLLTLCTVSYASLTSKFWSQATSFLTIPGSKLIPLGLLAGVVLRCVIDFAGEHVTHIQGKADSFKRRWSLFYVFCLLFAVQAFQGYLGDSKLQCHQLESLMRGAKQQHHSWLEMASFSTSLTEATARYIARYDSYPPPNFDKWYAYAQNRSSYIIDEFDAIYEDLLPFWSLSPTEIRRRTKEALNSPTGGLGGVRIRNGEAIPMGNGPNSDRWELSTMAEMINNFAEFLPDMDLAFNLNDECRVSLPYHDLKNALQRAESKARNWKTGSPIVNSFGVERAKGWSTEAEGNPNLDRFIVLSFQNTFGFSSAHCGPDSLAHSEVHQDPEIFCASCASPHSLDLFMSNWSLAADVCHQPDLAHLHGFYISPAAFDATSNLVPIFSQSKAGGFQDIRHPSPFNYMETAKYMPSEEFPDPEWGMKKHAVFWRGANSDGFSRGGTGAWRGMERQRLVNLVQNISAAQALLLPDIRRNGRFRYALVDPRDLHASVDTDVRFSQIYRCDEPDCGEQESHFGVGSKKNFQEHWGYKYLLDADGAGYSGRFIPFLLSKSLPFKMALFREWWEGRVFPWLHFIPLDLRGQGLWASLTYFAGFKGSGIGDNMYWPPMDDQAKVIADEGAAWARKVLRKEDMEIYMFRLLLEWGRLTDDRRSEVGFSVHS